MSEAARDSVASSFPSVRRPSDFEALDDGLPAGRGSWIVRVETEADRDALFAHLRRRLASHGRGLAVASCGSARSTFRELEARLGLERGDDEPRAFAARLARVATSRGVVLAAPTPGQDTWDHVVADELGRSDEAPLLVLVATTADVESTLEARRFVIGRDPSEADRRRVLEACAEQAARAMQGASLADLDAFWRQAQREPTAPSEPAASESHESSWLSRAGRAWPLHAWRARGLRSDAPGVESRDGWVSLAPSNAKPAESRTEDLALARALVEDFPSDAHAWQRAAELQLEVGDVELADTTHATALARTSDVRVRRELLARWRHALESLRESQRGPLQSRAAERALACGEAEEAFRWARSASALVADDGACSWLVARTALAMGDLVVARAELDRASDHAADAELRACVAAERAELSYLSGDLEASRDLATRVSDSDASPSTRLRARNTLGKLLLASGAWDEAEAHFAADAATAARLGDRTSELRARVNRSIAIMSRGRVDAARSMLDEVLAEAERLGDARACAFALDNLAVLAMWRHDYAEALSCFERTLAHRLKLGDRLATARVVANLAELRRKLGLHEHAEHAVAFGRRLLGPGTPTEMSAHFAAVAARLALARGNTEQARREVARAIADGAAVGHESHLGEDYRVAARAALEDGALALAASHIAEASTRASTDEARAEVAVLEAMLARASGRSDRALADRALELARACGEEELTREAATIASDFARDEGDLRAVDALLRVAIEVGETVAASLPPHLRDAYRARPELAALVARSRARSASDDSERASPPSVGRARSGTERALLGEDPRMRALTVAIRRVARTDSTVLVRGESGTGKELVAEALHRESPRARGPLVIVHCAALVETLLLSELFGHEKGAFTGATSRKQGRFELADGGTLFLDEIGELTPRTQVALLRVLQERSFERVGGTSTLQVNVRVVCATHRDLRAMVDRGEFREDLYYRLRGITLEVPPLRERLGDLPLLGSELLARAARERREAPKSLSPSALALLERHRWPGNVRELDNVLRAASLFAEGETLHASDLVDHLSDVRGAASDALRSTPPPSESSDPELASDAEAPLPPFEAGPTAAAYATVRQGAVSLGDLKRQIERDCIARALAETGGNITHAAALLGMKRPRLSQLVKQYGLAAASQELA